jgi:hypothetical protein
MPTLAAIPLDLTAAGTEIAGYVGTAATAGAVVFIAIVAVRVVKSMFKSVAR